jgi:uncharacterized membrane protein
VYQGLVFLHLIGVVVFALGHGVSMLVAFRIRGEQEPRVVSALLGLSQMSTGLTYVGLLLLGIGGLGAAAQAGLLLAPWIVASYVVLVVVLAVMYSVASPYYGRLRELVGSAGAVAADGSSAADPEELRRALRTRRPEVLLVVGSVGLLVLVWLMVFRPG